MFKTCLDCLFGGGPQAEEPYSTQLNGNVSRAPPWPTPQMENEKLFILPKILNTMDRIIVKGDTLADPRTLTIGLVTGYGTPDYSNIACQLDINFVDKIAIQCVENGNIETIDDQNVASEFFTDAEFEIQFHVRSPNHFGVYVGSSYLETVALKHDVNDIRFLTVHGDVNRVSRLDFKFG